jgi:hypothetical protein
VSFVCPLCVLCASFLCVASRTAYQSMHHDGVCLVVARNRRHLAEESQGHRDRLVRTLVSCSIDKRGIGHSVWLHIATSHHVQHLQSPANASSSRARPRSFGIGINERVEYDHVRCNPTFSHTVKEEICLFNRPFAHAVGRTKGAKLDKRCITAAIGPLFQAPQSDAAPGTTVRHSLPH